eukprot:TRINITY_DN904_c0_g2_i1.p1 TRINITY_DN904_c0_g2~~TRINITY_DN904_c0_g2_i1.p1  ORF type:complete len:175 (-),score=33.19 TRINITY_DN904_c0_g2_i1:69-593(-)
MGNKLEFFRKETIGDREFQHTLIVDKKKATFRFQSLEIHRTTELIYYSDRIYLGQFEFLSRESHTVPMKVIQLRKIYTTINNEEGSSTIHKRNFEPLCTAQTVEVREKVDDMEGPVTYYTVPEDYLDFRVFFEGSKSKFKRAHVQYNIPFEAQEKEEDEIELGPLHKAILALVK